MSEVCFYCGKAEATLEINMKATVGGKVEEITRGICPACAKELIKEMQAANRSACSMAAREDDSAGWDDGDETCDDGPEAA